MLLLMLLRQFNFFHFPGVLKNVVPLKNLIDVVVCGGVHFYGVGPVCGVVVAVVVVVVTPSFFDAFVVDGVVAAGGVAVVVVVAVVVKVVKAPSAWTFPEL